MTGPILGPVIGGIITDLASWRWVFAINLPLGLLAVWCMGRVRVGLSETQSTKIDIAGIVLLMLGVGAIQLCLMRGVGRPWPRTPEILGESDDRHPRFHPACAARPIHELCPHPDHGFPRDLNFATATFFNFMLSALLFVAVLFVPLLGEGPLGLSAAAAGALIMPRAILMTAMMLTIGRLIERIDLSCFCSSGGG